MWIKLHKKLLNWEWYSDINVTRLFIHLLLIANWQDGRFKGVEIPRGSLITGRKKLAKETGLSEQQIRTAIDKLKSTNEITTITTNTFTIISIQNYDIYQENNQESNQRVTNEQPTSNHNNRIIEYIEEKENINNMVITNNYKKNVLCDCLTEQKTKCKRRSIYNINGQNYCNQHSKKILKEYFNNGFSKPTLEEVQNYIDEKELKISAESFIDYYEANGWKIGRNPMKDWKATLRNWNRRQTTEIKKKKSHFEEVMDKFMEEKYD